MAEGLEKLKNIIMPSSARSEGGYFAGVGRRYRLAGMAIAVLLVIFILASLIFGYREFTYQNVYYFFRELDSVLSSESYAVQSISYGSGEARSYAAFKGGVAVADRYSVSVYSAGGRCTAEFNVGYFSPQLRSAGKYLLIYSSDGSAFSVCNSFVRLYSETLDTAIYDAAINSRGEVLIHTGDSKHRAVLRLYDSGFSQVAAYRIGAYVTSAALSEDGKYVLAATVDAEGGQLTSALRAYRRGETDSVELLGVTDELILRCGAFSNDNFYAVTDRGAYVVDAAGRSVAQLPFDAGASPIIMDATGDCLTVVVGSGSDYRLVALLADGTCAEHALAACPQSLSTVGRMAYLLLDGAVAEYDLGRGTVSLLECAPGGLDMVAEAPHRVLICYAAEAAYYEFSEVGG